MEDNGKAPEDIRKKWLIKMIVGGPADGDSFRARKVGERALRREAEGGLQEVGYVRITPRIHFGPEDGGM